MYNALTILMYPSRAIKPMFNMKAKTFCSLHRCGNFTPLLAQIPRSHVQACYPERCVKGRHEDISQYKIIVNKMLVTVCIAECLLTTKRTSTLLIWKQGRSNGEGCPQRNFRSRATKMILGLSRSVTQVAVNIKRNQTNI